MGKNNGYKKITFDDVTQNNKPKPTNVNFNKLLGVYGFFPKFDFLKRKMIIDNPEYDNLEWPGEHRLENMITHIMNLVGYHGLRMSERQIIRLLTLIASENSFNPVAKWILSVRWDERTRIKELYETLDVQENKEFMFILFKKWLGYIVRCAFSVEGVATQGVIVLVGPEGCGKTTWISRLLPPTEGWVLSGENNLEPKADTFQKIDGFALVEFGEISALFNNHKTMEWLKALITSGERSYRLPYGRTPITRPNLTTFAGTDNNRILFPADYGKLLRRWWVIVVGKNLNAMHDVDMQQVYAELYQDQLIDPENAKKLGLSDEELQHLATINSLYCEEDPLKDAIVRQWEWDCFDLDDKATWNEKLTIGEVAEVLGIQHPTKRVTNQIGKILRDLTKLNTPLRFGGLKVYPMPTRNINANSYLVGTKTFCSN
jgi:energy-coupling factor transporter ATP-binding protein EcfA2